MSFGKKIELVSRAGEVSSFLIQIDEGVYEWKNSPNSHYFRISFDNINKNVIHMLDPDNGPAIFPGFVFEGKTVERIISQKKDDGTEKYIVYAK